jgi:hypothetical protein
MSGWRIANAEWLAESLDRLRLRLYRRALWLHRAMPDGTRAADWLIAVDHAAAEQRFHEDDAATTTLDQMIADRSAGLDDRERQMRAATRPPALRALSELAGLSTLEEELLLLAAAPALDGGFGQAYAELHANPGRPYATLQLALGVFAGCASERVLAADCLLPTGPLRALRLVDVADDDDRAEPLLTRRLAVDERMADYLRGMNRPDSRLVGLLSDVGAPVGSEIGARTATRVAELVAAEAGSWTTVNLVGTSEGGARDVAARACADLSLGLAVLDVAQLTAQPPVDRSRSLALLGREAVLGGLALLVDTAGLDPGGPAAAAVDEVIERVAATLFVVSADRWPGDGQSHRNAHVVGVVRPSRREQAALWRSALNGYTHSLNGEVDAIVQQFDFGPPTIAAAVARAGRVGGGTISGSALWTSCRQQIGAGLNELARRVTPGYAWDDIVVPAQVRAQLRELASQVEQRGRVYEGWGFGARLGRGRGITALFAGPSGTGKTMAAEILAAHLDLDLYRIDLAGVVSKYVGETEKNLRRVFDAAESSGAILLFDEADALFGSRTEVRDSHDRYANVEVNYLLQRMEDYTGLAILATNRRSALDTAFLRRLRFVIDFPFPSVEDRRRIWTGVFPPQAVLDGVEYAFLSRLELSGGNIRSIAVNAAFLAAAEERPIGMAHLVRATAREYTKLSKPISAAEFGAYHAVAQS